MKSVTSAETEPCGWVGVLHYKRPQEIDPLLPPLHTIIAFIFLTARKISKEVIMIKRTIAVLVSAVMFGCASGSGAEAKWISLFNGKDLSGWTVRGKATWSVQDGVLMGIGGMGHIYTDATCSDFEAKGMFRVTSQGATPNSGFYFRANPPADDVNGFPRGYEAQICNHMERAIPDGSGSRASRRARPRNCLPRTGNGFVTGSE